MRGWLTVSAVMVALCACTAADATAAAPVPDQPAAAVNPATGEQYVFWRGTNGDIHEAWYNGRWYGPRDLGWPASSSPAVAITDNGHQYVFWQGSNGDIEEAWYIGGWRGPRDLHWQTTSDPAAAVNPMTGEQYLLWRGTSGTILEASYSGGWSAPVDLHWRANSAPAVGVANDGRRYLFWVRPGGAVAEAWYQGTWQGPRVLPWRPSLGPAVAVDPATHRQDVFWTGTDGHVEETSYAGSWQAPRDLGWAAGSAPAAAVDDRGREYVFWQGNGGTLEEGYDNNGVWRGPVDKRWRLYVPRLVGCVPSGSSFVYSGPSNRHVVALTFDDGPWYDTPQFLDVLERERVPATFFQIGEQIGTYGQAVDRRMLADGDIIGDHTWDHSNVSGGGSYAAWEITSTASAINSVTGGFSPCLFRAPGGAVSPALISEARSLGFITIQWDVDPRDWARPGAEAIYQNVVSNAHNGSIILQHDGGGDRSETLAALPREIDTLRSEGYGFVTVADLLGLQLVYR